MKRKSNFDDERPAKRPVIPDYNVKNVRLRSEEISHAFNETKKYNENLILLQTPKTEQELVHLFANSICDMSVTKQVGESLTLRSAFVRALNLCPDQPRPEQQFEVTIGTSPSNITEFWRLWILIAQCIQYQERSFPNLCFKFKVKSGFELIPCDWGFYSFHKLLRSIPFVEIREGLKTQNGKPKFFAALKRGAFLKASLIKVMENSIPRLVPTPRPLMVGGTMEELYFVLCRARRIKFY